ncbi:coiled-coil domain-containing protein [Amphibacillus jilinensis]|uniref:coiled-coil domain-containing protein n=1 Tax=Amphibacillus jilinensis TaxID=1216008 RepID=UPI0003134F5A|nr:C40 family peptidase [Amphibacillus jilinensis]
MNGKKVVVTLALTVGLTVTAPSINQVVNAQTESEIQAERSALQDELSEKRTELEDIQAELAELEAEIDRVNEDIEANEEDIEKTEAKVEETEAEIAELEDEIAELEEDMERRYNILKDRAAALQKNGGASSYLDVVFGAQNFTDFIDRVAMVTRISQADQSLLEQLEEDQETVEAQKMQVEDKLADLEETQDELERMQALIIEQKEIHEANMEHLEERKTEAQTIVEELEIEDSELEQMLQNARAEAARRQESQQSEIVQMSSSGSNNVPTVSAGSGSVNSVIASARTYLGNSTYKLGRGRTQADIEAGIFDCSAFVAWAFRQQGVNLPAYTGGMASVGDKVSPSNMQPGDLVFFDTNGRNGHVGIYLGGGKFIGAQSSTGVAEANMSSGYWARNFSGHVRRVMN